MCLSTIFIKIESANIVLSTYNHNIITYVTVKCDFYIKKGLKQPFS